MTCGCDARSSSTCHQPAPVARIASACAGVDVLDVLGQQLGEEADGRERQRQEAGEGAEADHRDEQDRDDDLLEACATRR